MKCAMGFGSWLDRNFTSLEVCRAFTYVQLMTIQEEADAKNQGVLITIEAIS